MQHYLLEKLNGCDLCKEQYLSLKFKPWHIVIKYTLDLFNITLNYSSRFSKTINTGLGKAWHLMQT